MPVHIFLFTCPLFNQSKDGVVSFVSDYTRHLFVCQHFVEVQLINDHYVLKTPSYSADVSVVIVLCELHTSSINQ